MGNYDFYTNNSYLKTKQEKELSLTMAIAYHCRCYYQNLYTNKFNDKSQLDLKIDANAFASLLLKNVYIIEPVFKT